MNGNPVDQSDNGEHPFFRWWGHLVLRHHRVFAAAAVAVTVWSAWATVTQLRVDNSVELFIPEGAESVTVLEKLRDAFGQNELFIVVASGDVFTLPFLERLAALQEALANLNPPLASLGERLADRHKLRSGGVGEVEAEGDDAFGDFDDFEDGDAETWDALGGGTAVDEVISLVSARRTWMDGDTLHVGEWMDPRPTSDTLAAWRAAVLSEPLLVPRVVDAPGRHTTLGIRTHFMADEDSDRFHRAVLEALDEHRAPGFDLVLGGGPAIDATFNWLMLRDMTVLLALAVLVMLAVLTWLFRHPVGIVAPIVVVNLAVAWTLGLMAVTGMPVGLLSTMLPAFIFVVGVGDSVHVISVYRTERRAGVDGEEAIVRAVARTGLPVLFTTLTTTVGLLSFNFASVIAIRQLGIAGGAGVMMAMVSTLVVLPIGLYWTRGAGFGARPEVTPSSGGPDRIDRALAWCFSLSKAQPGARYPRLPMARVLAAGGILTVAAATAAPHIEVAHDPMGWFDDDVSVKRAATILDEAHGGCSTIQLLLRAPGDKGFKDLEVLRAMEGLESYLAAYTEPGNEDVTGPVWSILDVVRETHRALHGGAAKDHRLPDTQRGAADMLFLYENAGPAQLRRLATVDLRTTVMTVQVEWREASAYGPLVAYTRAGIERFVAPLGPERLQAEVTGGAPLFYSVVTSLIGDLLRSFGVALAVITALMLLFLGRVSLGLLAMVPNLLPIVFVLGFMAAVGIPVDLNNLLIGSIIIGIAVDDTIHLLHHVRVHLDRGASIDEALEHARTDAGKAVVSTSLILFFGYMTFVAGSVAPIIRFGLLCGLAIAMALLVDLIVLPALLRLLYARPTTTS
jgi:uncharacterized protein